MFLWRTQYKSKRWVIRASQQKPSLHVKEKKNQMSIIYMNRLENKRLFQLFLHWSNPPPSSKLTSRQNEDMNNCPYAIYITDLNVEKKNASVDSISVCKLQKIYTRRPTNWLLPSGNNNIFGKVIWLAASIVQI